MKHLLSRLAYFMVIICLPLALLLSSVQAVAFDASFYQNEYRKLNVASSLGTNEAELTKVTGALLDYLAGRRKILQISIVIKGHERPFFSERELLHMSDVKKLFVLGRWLRNGALFVTAVSLAVLWKVALYPGKAITRALLLAVFWPIPVFLLLFLLISRDFHQYFTYFHYLFFTNDLWLLDPAKDLLINLVPEPFFIHATRRIILYFAGSLALLFLLAVRIRKKLPS